MAKNILVTGLILGKESKMCICDNINLGWLYNRPTDLLWTDKIILTHNEWDVIIKDNNTPLGKATKMIFERLEAEGLIQQISDSSISIDRADSILQTINTDLQFIEDLYTESEDENDPIMSMGDYHFCVPSLWTLYAAIELSWRYDASFSLEQDEIAYLTALIPRKYQREILSGRNMAIDEVLSLYLPTVTLGHSYLFDSEKGRCASCKNDKICSESYLLQIEKQLESILSLRKYDEIRLTCEVMDKICERSMLQGHVLTGEELWDDLQEEAAKTEKKVTQRLSNIQRWSKITSYVSIGLGAASFLNPILGVSAAIPAVANQLLSSKEKNIKKETSWVSFVNNPEMVLRK